MSDVFISHSKRDRVFVMREIVSLLEQHGIKTWFDEDDIKIGSLWEEKIRQGLKSTRCFLLVMSKHSAQSDWVKSEVHWATKERLDRFIPVLIEDCDPMDFHLKLQRIQYVDFRSPTNKARTELLQSVQGNVCLPPTVKSDIEPNRRPEPNIRRIAVATIGVTLSVVALIKAPQYFITDKREELPLLQRGAVTASSVGRVTVDDGYQLQTGFLIAPNLLLTTGLPSSDVKSSSASFHYFVDARGSTAIPESRHVFKFAPHLFHYQSRSGEFSLVALENTSIDGQPLHKHLALACRVTAVKVGEPLSIIHYPGGKRKEMSLLNLTVANITEDEIHYSGKTADGSAGAPILDSDFRVVAMHLGRVPGPIDGESGIPALTDIRNGVKIAHVVEVLRNEALFHLDEKQREYIRRQFLDQCQQSY